ncbi:hypothetical protein [Blastopirellula marina]|uniref:Uncharacterized protein n=1 Tax=Blastopirellula marina TaxID=124 RepID=A0A2S8GUU1_9BACT|nr:hypothetical protein [Blastopirellula marina]PQO48198.1 hypothetical protein C5Y93_00505 [Blastopirellula marina]
MKPFLLAIIISFSGFLLGNIVAGWMANMLEASLAVPPDVTYATVFALLLSFAIQMAQRANGEAVEFGPAIESSALFAAFAAVFYTSQVSITATIVLTMFLGAYLLTRQSPTVRRMFASKSDRC